MGLRFPTTGLCLPMKLWISKQVGNYQLKLFQHLVQTDRAMEFDELEDEEDLIVPLKDI
jgi:hypothetical protein